MFIAKSVYASWLNIKLCNLIKCYINKFKYECKRIGGVLNLKFLERQNSVTLKKYYSFKYTLAWKIPWMEEPGRLHSMGSQRVGHD